MPQCKVYTVKHIRQSDTLNRTARTATSLRHVAWCPARRCHQSPAPQTQAHLPAHTPHSEAQATCLLAGVAAARYSAPTAKPAVTVPDRASKCVRNRQRDTSGTAEAAAAPEVRRRLNRTRRAPQAAMPAQRKRGTTGIDPDKVKARTASRLHRTAPPAGGAVTLTVSGSRGVGDQSCGRGRYNSYQYKHVRPGALLERRRRRGRANSRAVVMR